LRKSTIVMIGFAVLFGLLAVFLAQSWLNSQAEARLKSLEAQNQRKPMATQTIVVASRALRFGAEADASSLREIAWPEDAVPVGAFNKITDVLSSGGRRVVLTAIETNEPILASKITGPGQRATLSAALADGMRAMTIRVNDVEGVAGFVLPGDRVDVALTRQKDKDKATTDVVLQNTRVLAIDQTADDRNDKPSVVKAVTLEVDTVSAQKLALAASVGALSLMLRKAGEATSSAMRTVSLSDLTAGEVPASQIAQEMTFATIKVHRPVGKKDDPKIVTEVYTVPTENAGGQTLASAERRRVAR
jgi:pilus assembly protein CpaB